MSASRSKSLQKWVVFLLAANRGLRPMPWNYHSIFGQIEKPRLDGCQYLPPVSTRQIRSAYAVTKKRVTRDQLILLRDPNGLTSWRMARGVKNVELRLT
jgi:hypothetical protein